MGDKVAQNPDSISYLTQREAAEIDETLMGPLGFSVDQLMVILNHRLIFHLFFLFFFLLCIVFPENHFRSCNQELAGLSVATSIAEVMLQEFKACIQNLYDALLFCVKKVQKMVFVLDRLTKQVSIAVFSLFAVLGTTVVMVLWLLVICITLVTNPLFVIQSVLRSLFILVWSLRFRQCPFF